MSKALQEKNLVASRAVVRNPVSGNHPRLVVWMASIGSLFLALEIYVFVSWMLSPHFTPALKGTDPIPDITLMLVRVFELLQPVLCAVTLYFVWRTSKREGRLSLFGIIALAWLTLWWQDVIWYWARPSQFYNAYFLNMGNWSSQVPGWISPVSHLVGEPIIFGLGAYMWFNALGTMIVVWSMRWARNRWPALGVVQLCLIGFLAMAVFDLVQEVSWIRTQLYAYPATISALSIWGGKTYQFPVYESIGWGAVVSVVGYLYFFRDDRGMTLLDRGLNRVSAVRNHSLIRWLAMVGLMNILYLTYNVFMIFSTFHADPTPEGYPSWLRAGVCGADTQYDCPGPNVAIPLPGSGPNRAYRLSNDFMNIHSRRYEGTK